MDLIHKFWPRESLSTDLGSSLADRLKELSEDNQPSPSASGPVGPIGQAQAAPMPDAAGEPTVANPAHAAAQEAVSSEGQPEIQEAEEPVLVGAEQHATFAVAAEPDGPGSQTSVATLTAPPEAAGAASDMGKASPLDGHGNGEPPAEAAQARGAETQGTSRPSEQASEGSSSPSSKGPGQLLMERIGAAVDRTGEGRPTSTASNWQMPPEFQSAQQQFEADLRVRVDGALAEFERRMSSQALVEDIAGPLEERIRKTSDGIFREVQGQAWMMHNAVAGELRAFRDQFAKEIQERVGLLDQAAQQALQLRERLEQALPRAEEALRSLSLSGQEAAAKFQAASDVFDDHLRGSREALSREIDAHRQALAAMADGFRQDGQQLKEEVERFRTEAGAAHDLLVRAADESLERLSTGADEVHARSRDGLEKLATETERRILSGGVVEKATEQLAQATQQLLEPSLERIRKATQEAGFTVDSLTHTGQRVSGQLDAARKEIEARLESLLNEQLSLVENSMSGFQSKATEELGNLVERVVSQSSEQLDERLRVLLQDLFATTSKQINGAARATLGTLHTGLKEAFEPPATAAEADSGDPPAQQQ